MPNRQGALKENMQIPGAHLMTALDPALYSAAQIDQACAVAHLLRRGCFVLCVRPAREDD
jgi:hypothetical protein